MEKLRKWADTDTGIKVIIIVIFLLSGGITYGIYWLHQTYPLYCILIDIPVLVFFSDWAIRCVFK